MMMSKKVLAVSDVELDLIYNPQVRSRFKDIELIIGCGDLPYYYLEYIISALDKPLFYVRGNHSNIKEYTSSGSIGAPQGGIDLHRRIIFTNGLILAGIEGSLKYRNAPFQYSQSEMWEHVLRLVPALIRNKAIYGRYLDIFVSHAPPWGIHDQPDLPHQGIKAFRWLLEVFKPAYHFHGHIHLYRRDAIKVTHFMNTDVVNAYGFIESSVEPIKGGLAPLRFLRNHKEMKSS
jgi:Icc-related predicted phosphoesterase